MKTLITTATTTATLVATVLSTPAAFAGSSGPNSTYYVAGDFELHGFNSGGKVFSSFTAYGDEYAIAVNGDIRTLDFSSGDSGGLYDLNGVSQATPFANTFSNQVYDSTTDGQSHFTVDFVSGAVVRTDNTYQNPTTLFSVSTTSLGVTYDPTNNSLWISTWSTGDVTEYDLAGNVLRNFNTGLVNQSALALDHTDGTLWLFDRASSDRYVQFQKDGTFLGDWNSGKTGNWLGGEFDYALVPAPGAFALLGIAGCVSRRRRRTA